MKAPSELWELHNWPQVSAHVAGPARIISEPWSWISENDPNNEHTKKMYVLYALPALVTLPNVEEPLGWLLSSRKEQTTRLHRPHILVPEVFLSEVMRKKGVMTIRHTTKGRETITLRLRRNWPELPHPAGWAASEWSWQNLITALRHGATERWAVQKSDFLKEDKTRN